MSSSDTARADTKAGITTDQHSISTDRPPPARRPPEDRAPWRALDEGLSRVR